MLDEKYIYNEIIKLRSQPLIPLKYKITFLHCYFETDFKFNINCLVTHTYQWVIL